MSEVTSHAPGTPSWVDLGSPDLEASVAFYSALFGWETESMGEAFGHYTMCRLGGRNAAGIGPLMGEGQPSAQPSAWSTYIAVEDAEKAIEVAAGAGASVVVSPMAIPGAGTMAVLVDPVGAHISLWQPGGHIGAEVADEPGAFCWNELRTTDTGAASTFYASAFGWEPVTQQMGPMKYTEFKLGGTSIAGMIEMGGMPPHWGVYFRVADCDAALSRVAELGGRALSPTMDLPVGRFAAVADNHGAVFSVIARPEGA